MINTFNEKDLGWTLAPLFIFILFILIWILLSIAALIMSIYCFKYGANINSIVGALIACIPILGPIYWIYFLWNSKYCKGTLIS